MRTVKFGRTTITLIQGDITKENVDVIVNAANSALAGGGGVDGAIHRVGGPEIMEECRKIRAEKGGCPEGEAVATTAGKLPAKWVVHTVGPRWGLQSDEASDEILANAYRNSLALAESLGAKTAAFPSISTGVYGFPIERAAPLVLRTVQEYLEQSELEEVRFVLFSGSDLEVYDRALAAMGQ
jgi:O-acetyl-ADP-ribose deacetylase (regulator of RNase III)